MIEAVVFDLDGVLVDSEPVWEQVRRQVVAEHGGHWAPDAQQRLMGMSTGEWAWYLGQDLGAGLPPETIAALVIDQMKARYAEHVPFLPGAVGAVRRMAARWPAAPTALERSSTPGWPAWQLSVRRSRRSPHLPLSMLAERAAGGFSQPALIRRRVARRHRESVR